MFGMHLEKNWEYRTKGTVYSKPLVADVTPNPSDEIIISDGEARILRCIDSTGKQIWEYDGNWLMRLISVAAISFNTNPGFPVLAIGNPDGKLCCLNASTGEELWTKNIGKIEWGSPSWTDLDGSGQDELIAATEFDGITAFKADGTILYTMVLERGNLDVIVTSGDHFVYVLGAEGNLKGKYKEGRRLMAPATIADINKNGKKDILFGSSGRKLNSISISDKMTRENTNFLSEIESSSKNKTKVTFPLFDKGGFKLAKKT